MSNPRPLFGCGCTSFELLSGPGRRIRSRLQYTVQLLPLLSAARCPRVTNRLENGRHLRPPALPAHGSHGLSSPSRPASSTVTSLISGESVSQFAKATGGISRTVVGLTSDPGDAEWYALAFRDTFNADAKALR